MFLIRAALVVLSTIYWGTLSLFASFFDSTGRMQMSCSRRWAKQLLSIGGVRVTLDGIDKIKPEASYVIASNHLSYYDTPVILASIPVQFRFLAKRGLFQIPFLGTHLARAGHIPIPRADPRAALKVMTLAAETIRTRGISMLIFPEGGRSPDGELQSFKDGVTYIGIKSGAPIVPIALVGSREILPFGSGRIQPGAVTLRIGDPIDTAALSLKERAAVTERIREEIAAMIAKGR
ncbi:MAG: 1-acyl-sn-glycerol-3-phosphate acyltransferase [Acidobacteria bacterium]|mgnify:FL=1|nr:1-acyl-sn-glycerol-3-phosphate acyltransferase [Acidobacteriota bacterium]